MKVKLKYGKVTKGDVIMRGACLSKTEEISYNDGFVEIEISVRNPDYGYKAGAREHKVIYSHKKENCNIDLWLDEFFSSHYAYAEAIKKVPMLTPTHYVFLYYVIFCIIKKNHWSKIKKDLVLHDELIEDDDEYINSFCHEILGYRCSQEAVRQITEIAYFDRCIQHEEYKKTGGSAW